MKISNSFLFILPGLILAACSENLEENAQTESQSQVLFNVKPFVSETGATRTTVDPDNGYTITWASGDKIGIFPTDNYQEMFAIPSDQVGKEYATFDGGSWSLKTGKTYMAYYPFTPMDQADGYETNMQNIPVTYLGQSQTGTTCNAGAYDYTYSDKETDTSGSVSFVFSHIGAIGVFTLKLPATGTYTSLSFNADSKIIPTTGHYDLSADAPAFIADDDQKVSSLPMTLDITGTIGDEVKIYMMLPPCDLSEANLTATLSTDTKDYVYTLSSVNIKAGKLVNLTGTYANLLTFTAQTAGSTIKLGYNYSSGAEVEKDIEYTTDGKKWSTYELGTTITLSDVGSYVCFQSSDTNPMYSSGNNLRFFMTGQIAASGSIQSLLAYSDNVPANAFPELFNGCSSLTTAPELPATTLAEGCYSNMFFDCTSLTTAPELPAATLATKCYYNMFSGCTSLTTAPSLPASILAQQCYAGMFMGCKGLVTAPNLPSKELATACYAQMFQECSSLETAPYLPAIQLVDGCYYKMFNTCTKLNYVKAMFTTTPSDDYTEAWLEGVAETGTFVKNASATWNVTGTNGVPTGWATSTAYQNLLPGIFSVSATKQVQFTKSNLYWDGSAFKFEENQTDYPPSWNANHVGHFFWTNLTDYQSGTASYMPYASSYSYSSQSKSDKFWCGEDNPLTVEGTNGLYALTGGENGEWYYLINSRTNASSLYKYGVTVTNDGTSYTNCLIIAPDDYSETLKSSYTLDEVNAAGLVCLPAAGYRDGSSFVNGGSWGGYWSASPSSYYSTYACFLFSYSSNASPVNDYYRYYGWSLRLVRGL